MKEELDPDGLAAKRETARNLAEQALRAQDAGDDEEAERLYAEAERTDPQAVISVLQEHAADPNDTATGADAEPGNDEEVAAMTRTVEPGSAAPSRAGISGPGSGADST